MVDGMASATSLGGSMNRQVLGIAMAGAALAGAAGAAERIEINNIYPLNEESFQLADRIFFTQDNRGYYEVVEGPLENGPARCIGSGFGFRDGLNTITGICVFGEGEDTFTMSWKAGEQGAANSWKIVDGTGRFAGMTGEGIASTGTAVMYRAMPLRQTHIVGTVDIPND